MSDIVQQTIQDYYDELNIAGAFSTNGVLTHRTIHSDNNTGEREPRDSGPFVETAIVEQEWNKIDSKRRSVGDTLNHCSFERGVFICRIYVEAGLGNKDTRAQQVVSDKIKKNFVQLNLPTENNFFIRFGEATPRDPFQTRRQKGGQKLWWQLNLFIAYSYSETY